MSLKLGILGLLAEEPLHGYEVKARFEAMVGHTWEVNIGQIYSTMQRLERDNLVEAAGERGDQVDMALLSACAQHVVVELEARLLG